MCYLIRVSTSRADPRYNLPSISISYIKISSCPIASLVFVDQSSSRNSVIYRSNSDTLVIYDSSDYSLDSIILIVSQSFCTYNFMLPNLISFSSKVTYSWNSIAIGFCDVNKHLQSPISVKYFFQTPSCVDTVFSLGRQSADLIYLLLSLLSLQKRHPSDLVYPSSLMSIY